MVFLWPGLPKKIWEFWAPSHPVQKKPQGKLRCFPAGVLLSKIPWGGSGENLGCKHRTLRPGTLWPNHPGERPQNRAGPVWVVPNRFSTLGNTRQRGPENGSKTVRKRFENGSNFRKGFEKGSKRVRKRFEFSKRVRKGFEKGSKTVRDPFRNRFGTLSGSNFRKGFEKGSKRVRKRFEFSKRVRKRFENGSKTVRDPFRNRFGTLSGCHVSLARNRFRTCMGNRFRTVSEPFSDPFPVTCRFFGTFTELFSVFSGCAGRTWPHA